MAEPDVRKGMPPVKLPREEFERRYRSSFVDPAFRPLQRELDAIVAAAWDAYSHSRKAPLTRKAGPGFADPEYEIAVDWLAAREAVLEAQRRHDDAAAQPRILIINGSARSEHTCPGEMPGIGPAFQFERLGLVGVLAVCRRRIGITAVGTDSRSIIAFSAVEA